MDYMIKQGRVKYDHSTNKGTLVHGIVAEIPPSGPDFRTALCGTTPTKKSYGWEKNYGDPLITCPKCLKKTKELRIC